MEMYSWLLLTALFYAGTQVSAESPFMEATCRGKMTLTYHGHPSDCNKFFVCLDGRPFIMDCPYNLHFDAQHIICKQPGEVECAGFHHPHPHSPPPHQPPHHIPPGPHSGVIPHYPIPAHFPPPPNHIPPPPTTTTTTKKPKSKKTKPTTTTTTTTTTTSTTTKGPPESTEDSDEEEEPQKASMTKSASKNQVECCQFYIGMCWDC